MPGVMISYRNVNGQREFAANLERELANAGIETWMDVKNIPPLSRWEDEIFKGIIGSDYVVLCLSPEYFESETCRFECYIARGYGKKLLPLIVPYDRPESVFQLVPQFEETRGIDLYNFLNFHSQAVLGLPEDGSALTRRLIQAITNPTMTDIDYDVFVSYRRQYSVYATRIADDLNRAGINTFIGTRAIDAGADWRRAAWSAMLRAQVHIVILSPDVVQSEYIQLEVLVTRTKQNAHFIPILAEDLGNDNAVKAQIRESFATSRNLAVLNEIQWFIPGADYQQMIDSLVTVIRTLLGAA